MDKIALTNVRVFDGQRLLEPATVVIDGDRIGGDQAGARTWDGGGGVLLPGLIDCHIHLTDDATLAALARHGVTTGLDMGTWPPELVASLRGRPGVTDVRSSGTGATHPASAHAKRMGRAAGPGRRSGRGQGLRRPARRRGRRLHQDHRRSSRLRRAHGPGAGRSRPCARPAHHRPRRHAGRGAARPGGRRRRAHPRAPRPAPGGRRRAADPHLRAGRGAHPDDDGGDRRAARRHRARLLRCRPSHCRAVAPGGRHDPRRDRRQPGAVRARIPAVRHQPAPRTASCWSTRACPPSTRCDQRRFSRPSNSGCPTGGSSHRASGPTWCLSTVTRCMTSARSARSRRCGAPASQSPTRPAGRRQDEDHQAQGTSTKRPRRPPLDTRSCAAATRSSGNVSATRRASLPVSTSATRSARRAPSALIQM